MFVRARVCMGECVSVALCTPTVLFTAGARCVALCVRVCVSDCVSVCVWVWKCTNSHIHCWCQMCVSV